MPRFSSGTRYSSGGYSRVCVIPAECHISDGSSVYGNTGPKDWGVWQGRYSHYGMRPPEFYYPNGPYNVEGTQITTVTGCHAVGLNTFNCYSVSPGSGEPHTRPVTTSVNEPETRCLIVFGGSRGITEKNTTILNSNIGSFREGQKIAKGSQRITFYAYPSPPPPTFYAGGVYASAFGVVYGCNDCCDIKYMVVSGEFPPNLTLDMETGEAYGFISEMDLPDNPGDPTSKDYFMERWRLPPDFRINEKNYATVGSASSFRNGRGAENIAKFVIRAFNARDPRVFTDKEFSISISNNWSSDRDRLIININNQFYVDGNPTSNKEYLNKMKERGFFD
jgi:hypothetical protein